MLKKTKFIVGLALLVQAITCLTIFVVLLVKKKSLSKVFLIIGLLGGIAGTIVTIKALKEDKQFKAMMAAVDTMCDFNGADEDVEILIDDTASEEDFE